MKLEAEGQTESDTRIFIKSLRYEHHVHVMQLSPVSSFVLCLCSGFHNRRQTRTLIKEIYFLHIGGSVHQQSTCRKVSGVTSLPGTERACPLYLHVALLWHKHREWPPLSVSLHPRYSPIGTWGFSMYIQDHTI